MHIQAMLKASGVADLPPEEMADLDEALAPGESGAEAESAAEDETGTEEERSG